MPCELRSQCLRNPEKTKTRQGALTRQGAFFQGKRVANESHTDRRKVRIDSERGRERITRRFATVEPVFGNLRHNKRLDRFPLRSRTKVDGQGKRYCITHHIEKPAHPG